MGELPDPQSTDSALLIADLRQELEDTNRGLIALHTELDAARRAEARLAAIVTSSDDAMISVDPAPAHLIQTWNPGARRLFGHTEQQIIGQPVDTLMPDAGLDAFRTAAEQIRCQGHAEPHESRWRRVDGSEVDVAVTASAMRDTDGTLIGFSTVARDITQRLAVQAELATARADREVQEDRDRIARDMHDLVIQRLFAGALSLQSTLGRVTDRPQVGERIQRVVDDLDDTIKVIRSTIYALGERDQDRRGSGLRSRLVEATERAVEALGFTPALRMTGLLDTDVPAEYAEHLLAVLGEALSNAARHAHATAVDVSVEVTATELRLQVADNGGGINPAVTRRSGLSNLRWRAEELGGTLTLTSNPPAGTVLGWIAPLPGNTG
ncbi:PAS domain S-box protein [Streptomyces sp. NBC_00996]|uniref:PAS domain-containing sensor histidine kinase n=1 Tax=Streptomyces sp. NBC_00996 TaxID=2903710 RepID=UPI003865B79B|nr:PAS domain S-box protein [Streptomyces sp. NBC_00996]